jgi:L-threonylcarbamoyladenylate synthase
MKYKHYSPKARVVLYEATYGDGRDGVTASDVEALKARENGSAMAANRAASRKVGVIRTQRWGPAAGLTSLEPQDDHNGHDQNQDADDGDPQTLFNIQKGPLVDEAGCSFGHVLDIDLGKETRGIAQGLFSALRALDRCGAETIFVDGIEDEIDIAAAVMNRLRKAASEIRS